MIVRAFLLLVVACCSARAALAQRELARANGDYFLDALASDLAVGSDIDGDGVREIITGAAYNMVSGHYSGLIRIFSPGSGAVLVSIPASSAGEEFGFQIKILPDLDGDGILDFAASAPGFTSDGLARRGKVSVYSAKTGQLLSTFLGQVAHENLGSGLSAAGDLDGDGFADLAVTGRYTVRVFSLLSRQQIYFDQFFNRSRAQEPVSSVAIVGRSGAVGKLLIGYTGYYPHSYGPYQLGLVRVLQGISGIEVGRIPGNVSAAGFGDSIAVIEDLSGDGNSEFLVSAPNQRSGVLYKAGAVHVIDGANFSILRSFFGTADGSNLGIRLVVTPDQDGDGVQDLLLEESLQFPYFVSSRSGARLGSFPGASVELYQRIFAVSDLGGVFGTSVLSSYSNDSANGHHAGKVIIDSLTASVSPKKLLGGPASDSDMGATLKLIPDTNGDGIKDLLVGDPQSDVAYNNAGQYKVLSGRDLSTLRVQFGQAAISSLGASMAGIYSGETLTSLASSDYYLPPSEEDRANRIQFLDPATGVIQGDLRGPASDIFFGFDIFEIGDVNTDGVSDLAARTLRALPSDDVYVRSLVILSGSSRAELAMLRGDPSGLGGFGNQVSNIGDVNGDGVPDFVVGGSAPPGEPHRTGFSVYSGSSRTALYSVFSSETFDRFGLQVASGFDLNGDGIFDILTSAPREANGNLTYAGRISGYSGKDGALLFTVRGAADYASLGEAQGFLSDVDGDLVPDFWAAEKRVISIRSGKTGAELRRIDPTAFGASYDLRRVVEVGDTDGDGTREVAAVLGAPEGPFINLISFSGTPNALAPTPAPSPGPLYLPTPTPTPRQSGTIAAPQQTPTPPIFSSPTPRPSSTPTAFGGTNSEDESASYKLKLRASARVVGSRMSLRFETVFTDRDGIAPESEAPSCSFQLSLSDKRSALANSSLRAISAQKLRSIMVINKVAPLTSRIKRLYVGSRLVCDGVNVNTVTTLTVPKVRGKSLPLKEWLATVTQKSQTAVVMEF